MPTMTIERAIRLARVWAFGGVNTLKEGDAQEYHKMALDALIEKQTREEQKALTLDELRQMAGEPVWVQSPGVPEYGRWAIVEGVDTTDGDKILYLHDDFTCHEYGRVWLAYRYKPREDGNEQGC